MHLHIHMALMARGSRGGEPGTGGPTDHAPGPGLLQPRPGPGGRPAGSDALSPSS